MWNGQDLARIPDVISETYTEYNPVAPGGEVRGRDGFEEWMETITASFSDFEADITEVIADEETAMAEIAFSMTHTGEFNGIPPTDREVEFRGVGKFRVENGKVEELRNYFDSRTLLEQLGATDTETVG